MVRTIIRDRYTLTKVSEDATAEDAQTVRDVLDTLDAYSLFVGGICANMIGVNKRIIAVIDTREMIPQYRVMINPVITRATRPYVAIEECICIPSRKKRCRRYKNVSVKYLNESMEEQSGKFTDELAEVIQHLIDHCNGIMI